MHPPTSRFRLQKLRGVSIGPAVVWEDFPVDALPRVVDFVLPSTWHPHATRSVGLFWLFS